LEEIKGLIYKFTTTINCPSNWRDIAEEFKKEYNTTEKDEFLKLCNCGIIKK